MGTPLLDDEAIEAFFLGTAPAGEDDAALATLAHEVLVATDGPPPRPRGALLAFLGDAVPSAWAAPTLVALPTAEPAPSEASPWQARPRPAVDPTTPTISTDPSSNVRRLVSRRLRLTAGIAAGVAIAAACLTVAGTTGVLPDPALRAIAQVVEAVTPFEVSEPAPPPTPPVRTPQPGTTSAGTATGAEPDAATQNGPPEQPGANAPPPGPPASTPPVAQGPGQPGNPGLDRAGQTPAGSFIPPFVTDGTPGPPAPPAAGGDGTAPPATGVDRARETPAGTFAPPFAGRPPGRP